MSRVAFVTLGCKVNQYDTQAMRECFLQAGYQEVSVHDAADVYVVNTCTVTGTGDSKSLAEVRRCHRRNPEAEIVVAGCLAQRRPEEMRLPGVRLVLGNQRRMEVVTLLQQAEAEDCTLIAVDRLTHVPFEALCVHANEGRTRAVMKIQEGCDRYCTYCIIPYVRGPIRSRPLAAVRQEAESLGAAGFREVVVTGIHLTSYGRDLRDGTDLLSALQVIHDVEGIDRIRLGSLEPVVVTEKFAAGIQKLPKVCRQFHLALQSGSDTVLRAMHRRYTTEEFLHSVCLLREKIPGCAITTDVMTGFPGEGEKEFEETRRTCAAAAFERMHVFPYSEREGTPAAALPGSVPRAVREERARILIADGKALQAAGLQQRVGGTEEVLLEEVEGDRGEGYTDSYLRCIVEKNPASVYDTGAFVPSGIVKVRIVSVKGDALQGVMEEES